MFFSLFNRFLFILWEFCLCTQCVFNQTQSCSFRLNQLYSTMSSSQPHVLLPYHTKSSAASAWMQDCPLEHGQSTRGPEDNWVPHLSTHQLPITPRLVAELHEPTSTQAEILPGLILGRSCVGTHRCHDLARKVVMLCQENIVRHDVP